MENINTYIRMHICNPVLRWLRQEDCYEFETSLSYINEYVPGQLGVHSKTCVRQKGKRGGGNHKFGLKILEFFFATEFFFFCVHMPCKPWHVCGGQKITYGVTSFLLPCRSQGSNSGHQALWQAPLLSEPC